jgi:hypothetical protein
MSGLRPATPDDAPRCRLSRSRSFRFRLTSVARLSAFGASAMPGGGASRRSRGVLSSSEKVPPQARRQSPLTTCRLQTTDRRPQIAREDTQRERERGGSGGQRDARRDEGRCSVHSLCSPLSARRGSDTESRHHRATHRPGFFWIWAALFACVLHSSFLRSEGPHGRSQMHSGWC